MILLEEEKKAIEDLKDFKSISILYGNTFTMFLEQLKKYQEATDTVLNLITKLQEENKVFKRTLDEETADRSNDLLELQKKDKMIDLMALVILNYDDQLVINRYKNIDEVKEEFKELTKEKGE